MQLRRDTPQNGKRLAHNPDIPEVNRESDDTRHGALITGGRVFQPAALGKAGWKARPPFHRETTDDLRRQLKRLYIEVCLEKVRPLAQRPKVREQ